MTRAQQCMGPSNACGDLIQMLTSDNAEVAASGGFSGAVLDLAAP
jgi:hypothetical protein